LKSERIHHTDAEGRSASLVAQKLGKFILDVAAFLGAYRIFYFIEKGLALQLSGVFVFNVYSLPGTGQTENTGEPAVTQKK
jgi:hypothetical protein